MLDACKAGCSLYALNDSLSEDATFALSTPARPWSTRTLSAFCSHFAHIFTRSGLGVKRRLLLEKPHSELTPAYSLHSTKVSICGPRGGACRWQLARRQPSPNARRHIWAQLS